MDTVQILAIYGHESIVIDTSYSLVVEHLDDSRIVGVLPSEDRTDNFPVLIQLDGGIFEDIYWIVERSLTPGKLFAGGPYQSFSGFIYRRISGTSVTFLFLIIVEIISIVVIISIVAILVFHREISQVDLCHLDTFL
jgi:hypothetical protein